MESRHKALWGEQGQNLIENASIVIYGLDNAGLELLKSAAMLNIGDIYLVDSDQDLAESFFLDRRLKSGKARSEQLQELSDRLCTSDKSFSTMKFSKS